MITNGYCTVVRADDNGECRLVGTYPCMWQETEGYEVKKYGEENADKAAIWIPDLTADVKNHDYIVRGELSDISEFDPDTALTVMSAAKHDYGSEDMQHVEIGAR
ncbi:MAG: hypothetical protein HFJ89_11375 [Oscillospiraceae bacterium]|jgi:hypothetical protein|nr:hypothetical protein [Oscillospiraceae bacterium]